jgi:hypothetical protein
MSVAVLEQTHVGSAVLVSSEDLGYYISRATWKRAAALTAAIGRVLDRVPGDGVNRTVLCTWSMLLTRHVALILALLWLGVGHDCAC